MGEEKLHVAQVRRICREVILYRLVIAYVDENTFENAEVRIGVQRREYAALRHVLDYGYGLERYRFTARVRA